VNITAPIVGIHDQETALSGPVDWGRTDRARRKAVSH
jgi:hypothetical protein